MKYLVFIALLCASCEESFMQDFPTKVVTLELSQTPVILTVLTT